MRPSRKSTNRFLQLLYTFIGLGVVIAASVDVFNLAWGSGHWLGRMSFKWAAAFTGFELVFLAGLGVAILCVWLPERAAILEGRVVDWRERLGWLRWPLILVAAAFPGWLFLFSPWASLFTGIGLQLFVTVFAFAAVAGLVTRSTQSYSSWTSLLAAGVVVGSAFAFAKLLVFVTDYPFSLYWSEGNRLWDYSLLFGRDRYLYPPERPIKVSLDLGRQALGGLLFLLPGVSIEAVRLWNALIFSIPYAVLGWAAVKLTKGAVWGWLLFGLWTFIFLNQGPVWSPLVLAAILVAIVRRQPLWLALPVVAAAGYLMARSRTTWIFAPSLWAGTLALAQVNGEEGRLRFKDWGAAILLASAGVVGSFGIPRLWPRLSAALFNGGGLTDSVGESLQSATENFLDQAETLATQHALLWERLLPNATFSLGILVGLLLVSLPLILLLVYLVRTKRWCLNGWQILAISGMSLAFLSVGLVASVKVGGGTNLHNLDMFLVGLVFVAALAWEATRVRELSDLMRESPWTRLLLVLVVFVPAVTPMIKAGPARLPEAEKVEAALEGVQRFAACAQEHGEVLFIDQRQLLTFGFVKGVPLVPEYEKKYMMDQALKGDSEYFDEFYQDLEEKRFSLIVTDRQFVVFKQNWESLAVENNAWVQWVTIPLLREYEAVESYKLVGVELYMPIGRDYQCP